MKTRSARFRLWKDLHKQRLLADRQFRMTGNPISSHRSLMTALDDLKLTFVLSNFLPIGGFLARRQITHKCTRVSIDHAPHSIYRSDATRVTV